MEVRESHFGNMSTENSPANFFLRSCYTGQRLNYRTWEGCLY
jgi:hypothetical protein